MLCILSALRNLILIMSCFLKTSQIEPFIYPVLINLMELERTHLYGDMARVKGTLNFEKY